MGMPTTRRMTFRGARAPCAGAARSGILSSDFQPARNRWRVRHRGSSGWAASIPGTTAGATDAVSSGTPKAGALTPGCHEPGRLGQPRCRGSARAYGDAGGEPPRGSWLGELHDDLDVVGLSGEGPLDIRRAHAPGDELFEPRPICSSQHPSGSEVV